MARQIKVLELFISSPSDVAAERDAVEEVVKSINSIISRQQGVLIEPVRWETHSHPDVGEDVQDVLNGQLPVCSDIFVGIFWHRMGTPTGRAISGSAEEFLRIFQKWQAEPRTTKILIYFKADNPPLADIDPDQLRNLRAFKESVRGRGVFFMDFAGTETFKKLLTQHLHRVALELADQSLPLDRHNSALAVDAPADQVMGDLDQEVGLVEYIEQSNAAVSIVVEAFTGIGRQLDQLGSRLTADAELATSAAQTQDQQKMARAANSAAATLIEFADFLDLQLPVLAQALEKAADNMDGIIRMAPDFGNSNQNLLSMRGEIVELDRMLEDVIVANVRSLLESIKGTPRITTSIRRARREGQRSLEKFLSTIDGYSSRLQASLALVDELLK